MVFGNLEPAAETTSGRGRPSSEIAMTKPGDSFCGIYCGACSVLVHGTTGRVDRFVACARGIPARDIACGGCKSDAVYAGCRTCSFRDCATSRGVAHCVECAEFPCAAYAKWASAKRLLPHVEEAPASLAAIRRDGVEAWLSAQERRWSCPQCEARFSWYQETCAACGRDLADVAFGLGALRRLFCRLVLPRIYERGRSLKPDDGGRVP
jgi:hypothetical protein